MLSRKINYFVSFFFLLGMFTRVDPNVHTVIASSNNQTLVSGRVIVKIRPFSKSSDIKSKLSNSFQGYVKKQEPFLKKKLKKDFTNLNNIFILTTTTNTEDAIIKELQRNPAIEYAERDYIASYSLDPNDPYYLSDISATPLWYRGYLHMNYAWDQTTGDPQSPIAIIDSGIDFNHEDLARKIWTNPGEIANDGIDNDGNGFIDDIHGWNIYSNSNDTQDQFGHGTIVSAVVGASTNNAKGISSMVWQNPILPVKATVGNTGIMNYSDMAYGILYADSFDNVKTINISLGGYSNSSLLRDTVQNVLLNNKSVIVAASGNDNNNLLTKPFYPASYRGVAAVTGYKNGLLQVYNYGYGTTIAAPASDIYTAFLGSGTDYGYSSGTSVAAPFVSGEAALLASKYPQWNANEIYQALKFWADCPPDSPNCPLVNWTPHFGFGTMNPQMALLSKCFNSQEPIRTSIVLSSPQERASFTSQQTITIEGTITNNNFSRYEIYWGNGENPSDWSNIGINLTNNGLQPVINGRLATWNLSSIPVSDYYQLRIRIYGTSSCTDNLTGEERAIVYVTKVLPPTPTLIPTATPTPTPVSSCYKQSDGTWCIITQCFSCSSLSKICPYIPCKIIRGACQNQSCLSVNSKL